MRHYRAKQLPYYLLEAVKNWGKELGESENMRFIQVNFDIVIYIIHSG